MRKSVFVVIVERMRRIKMMIKGEHYEEDRFFIQSIKEYNNREISNEESESKDAV
jgi:hypothetical protein